MLKIDAHEIFSLNGNPKINIFLINFHSISSLIQSGFLSKAVTYHYHVGLTSLKVGITGDYTVSSSERLYNNHAMQEKLLSAYREKSQGKKPGKKAGEKKPRSNQNRQGDSRDDANPN